MIIQATLIDDAGITFDIIGSFKILFYLIFFILLSYKIRHWSSFNEVI